MTHAASPHAFATLRTALRGERPIFVRRESMPPNTLRWGHYELPWVEVSTDVFELIREQIPADFARTVLRQLAEVMERSRG